MLRLRLKTHSLDRRCSSVYAEATPNQRAKGHRLAFNGQPICEMCLINFNILLTVHLNIFIY